MIRVSEKELCVLRILARAQANGNNEVTLDFLCDAARKTVDPNEEQVNFRSGIVSTTKNLAYKLSRLGEYQLAPNDAKGRGNKLSYTLTGNFTELYADVIMSTSKKQREEHVVQGQVL